MTVLIPGHRYALDYFELPSNAADHQSLQFIQKEPTGNGNELRTINNGTTNEEVLKVMIDRMQYLNAKFPCRENAIVITKLEEALLWLEKRTRDRTARGVEGQHKA